MRSFNILLVFFAWILIAFSTFLRGQEKVSTDSKDSGHVFGDVFDTSNIQSTADALEIYEGLSVSDTVDLSFRGKVSSVCKMKGCWLVLELDDGKTARITFKDYGFFVPTDVEGKEVVVKGAAMVTEIDEKARKHYARDAGLSEGKIDSISGSEKSFSMVASGVMVKD